MAMSRSSSSSSRWKECCFVFFIVAHGVVAALQTPSIQRIKPSSSSSSSFARLSLSSSLQNGNHDAPEFSAGFDSHQMDALVERGKLEASLMQAASQGVLGGETTTTAKSSGFSSANHGTSKKKKKRNSKGPSTAMTARTLHQDGVVRLNGVLSPSVAATLRAEILERRAAAYAAMEKDEDTTLWRQYFADVLLKSNRCDLLLPLKGAPGVQRALQGLLGQGTRLADVLLSTLGEDAILYELAALISEPGAPRQPVHPDNPHQEHVPLMTCFVALQDVLSPMGPTTFLPNTHTAEAHAAFADASLGGQRDAMLETRPNVVALLNTGDASLFDSRTLHCGGANEPDGGDTRVLLYVSFTNPSATMPIGNVGSLSPDIQTTMTLRELRSKLALLSTNEDNNHSHTNNHIDPFDEEEKEAEAVREYRLAAEQGNADAQFNLGICYQRGEGVEKDGAEAIRWFRLAAEQGGPLAQCNLGFAHYHLEEHAEAAHWFGRAAEQGLAHAQHNLGICYSTGVGVPRDLGRAAELLQKAADQGHPGSKLAYEQTMNDILIMRSLLQSNNIDERQQ